MNKKNIRTFESLKDNRLLYEKDMPKFGYFLLSIIFVLLVIVVVFSIFTVKPYIVTAQGSLVGSNKNYVMSQYSGKISNVHMKEGQFVNKGDVLFTISSTDIDLQIKQLQLQKKTYADSMEKYELLSKAIKNDKNYFSKSKSSDSLYYSQYETYKNKLAQQNISKATLKSYGYKAKQISEELAKNKAARNQIKFEAMGSANQGKEESKVQLEQINSQIEALKTGKKDYIMKANTSGKLHLIGDYKDGMVVQGGNPVASIANSSDDAMVEALVSPSDRARINIGDDVTIEVSGLQQNIYGTLKGKVTKIDSDISTSQDGKNSYFKIEIKPEKTYLKDKAGKEVEISNGMEVQAQITYDKVTYFKYVMDALGINL